MLQSFCHHDIAFQEITNRQKGFPLPSGLGISLDMSFRPSREISDTQQLSFSASQTLSNSSKLTFSYTIKFLSLPVKITIPLRYFIKFSYNGTHYHGWQYQPNAVSVQETLCKALSTILNSPIELTGAGRTDTGVHAKVMFAHFDFNEIGSAAKHSMSDLPTVVQKLNSFLPKDIAVFEIMPVHDDAHARFDAKKRTYQYIINTQKDVFAQEMSWHYHQQLDINLMNEAAAILLHHKDFQCFSKVNTDVNTYHCNIMEAYWTKHNNNLVFTISADRFLRNMVRAIVGTLVNIGLHKINLTDFEKILESKNRNEAGASVPAHGLYLTAIAYDYVASPDSSSILLQALAAKDTADSRK